MAELLDTYQLRLSTDFALLYAFQADGRTGCGTQTFASSAPGAVAMCAGWKYADLDVTLERWDQIPPPAGEAWEDYDVLPWQELPGGGPLKVSGFDGDYPGGLDVTGLGRARVQVFAVGRHRYTYGDGPAEELEPERWLLRFFPDPDELDGLAGGRRRIAGSLPFDLRLPTWQAVLRLWSTNGWRSLGIDAFALLDRGFSLAGTAVTHDELLGHLRRATTGDRRWPDLTWQSPVAGDPAPFAMPPELLASMAPSEDRQDVPALLAAAARIPPLVTLADALECLVNLGVVARTGSRDGAALLCPSPAPPRAWEVFDLSPKRRAGVHVQGLQYGFGYLAEDVTHLLRWAPNSLIAASPRQIAERLALTTGQVRGVLELMALRRQIAMEPNPVDLDDEALFEFRLISENPQTPA